MIGWAPNSELIKMTKYWHRCVSRELIDSVMGQLLRHHNDERFQSFTVEPHARYAGIRNMPKTSGTITCRNVESGNQSFSAISQYFSYIKVNLERQIELARVVQLNMFNVNVTSLPMVW